MKIETLIDGEIMTVDQISVKHNLTYTQVYKRRRWNHNKQLYVFTHKKIRDRIKVWDIHGKLTVLSVPEITVAPSKSRDWVYCKCEWGNKSDVPYRRLYCNHTKACGCMNWSQKQS